VDELTMLTERLAAARGGTGGLVLMAGEPGIGKTRLAQELAGVADRQGVAVAWGRCREDGGAPAYFPWVQIVKRIAESTGLTAGELGRRWPQIASLVGISPSVRAPAIEPAERFRLFASVASLLEHCARNRGLVVIIDDLHRADEGSLALLRFLAPDLADMPVLTVAAYRDSEVEVSQPLAGTIGQIADGSNVPVVRLGGLGAHEVAGLIYHHAGSVSADVVEAVTARTAGNPFFVIEMAALLRSTTTSAESVARTALPATVREVIGQRVARLAAGTQQALRAAAVLGREFGRLPLADMLATSELAVAAALQPAASAGLISAGSEGGYRFVHALVQAVIYDAVPLPDAPNSTAWPLRRSPLPGR
jgi:predicted ATPase